MSRWNSEHAVAVIGAGVAGLTAAAALHQRGCQVTVYEQGLQAGRDGCSWWAGGMLAPWCEAVSAEPEVLHYGQLAAGWWSRHGAEVHQAGSLVLSLPRDRAELDHFAARSQAWQALDGPAIAGLEPDLDGRFARGLWYPQEAHLDPRQTLPAVAAGLAAQGVKFAWGQPVTAEQLPAGEIVDCRGLSARDGVTGLRGVRGEMMLIRSRDVSFQRPIRLLHPRMPLYLIPRHQDGLLMLGASSVETDYPGPITARTVMDLLAAASSLHPALAEAEVVELGVGVRPAFADHRPHLIRQGRVTHFNGLYRHGYLLAPWYAEHLASRLTDSKRVTDEHTGEW